MIPIVGATKAAHVEDNLGSLNVKLTAEHMNRLNDVSKIDLGFPGRFFVSESANRMAHGGMMDQIDWTGARL